MTARATVMASGNNHEFVQLSSKNGFTGVLRFKSEVRHSPNISFQADPNPRERGLGPLNSNR